MTTNGSPVPRRGVWGWMLFDWAAQPFFTVVTTFIFGPYFVSRMATRSCGGPGGLGLRHCRRRLRHRHHVAGAGLDRRPDRPAQAVDRLLRDHPDRVAVAAVVRRAGLALLPPLIFFCLATIAAEFSIVFNDSMMPRLVSKAEIGKVSNIAWGLGYLGGMIVLIFVVGFLAASPETGKTMLGLDPLFGLDPAKGEDARATGPLAALWYLVFIMPMFLFTPDSGKGKRLAAAVREGISELSDTLLEARQRPGIFRFLIARMIYQDGVNALLALGGTFAALMFAWSITEIGIYGIILNVIAIVGCLVASRADTVLGSKQVVLISLVLLTIATIGIVSTGPGFTLFGLVPLPSGDFGGLFGTAAEKAYIGYGLLIGLAFGPVQASSRSYLARSVSADEAGRYFGIYALAGRATSFTAPFLVATVTAATGSAPAGMAMILLFLVAGLIILLPTPYPANKPMA